MIYQAQFTSGFPLEIPTLGKTLFEFKPGINIVFGPNGSGKSVLLRTIAAHCSIPTGGWSRMLPAQGFQSPRTAKFPDAFAQYAPGNAAMDLVWDVMPVLFNAARESDTTNTTYFFDNPDESPDGFTDMQEQLQMLTGKASAGQMRQSKLMKVLEMARRSCPFPGDKGRDKAGDKVYKAQMDYLRQQYLACEAKYKKKETATTILLDEPEAGLSLPLTFLFWYGIIPQMHSAGYQTIVATHSPAALFCPTPKHIVELGKGYVDNCRTLLSKMTGTGVSRDDLLKACAEQQMGSAQN